MNREKLFSVTLEDCEVDVYRGSGKGGQKRNKTSSAVRVRHIPSGAIGQAEDGRSQLPNKKLAFGRMARTPKMQQWLRMEAARRAGVLADVEQKVERELRKVKVEIKDRNGRWAASPMDLI